jgi:predicted ATPase/DNA-binding CsgD family transcriptional regulator/DNA-binding XRE family transcriptional regulator
VTTIAISGSGIATVSDQVDDSAAFGEALRRFRHGRRLTQVQLARHAGLSERAISDLERGLKRPQRATIRLLADALRLESGDVEALEQAARSRQVLPRVTSGGSGLPHLPAVRTSFVGRQDDVASLRTLLDPKGASQGHAQLVTLTGAGGCGKTRLAIEVARGMIDEFTDGVWFIDLSSIGDGALVSTTLLAELGVQETPDESPVESVVRRVHGRQLLLVLDNCEHVIDTCAELLDTLLGASLELRVLATSREALRVPGELAWRVRSLATPEAGTVLGPDQLLEYEAALLLVDRIRRVDPRFALTTTNTDVVAQICSRLDGIPLALELAAARASVLSIQDIAARLVDCFHVLKGGSRTAIERHRTLRATIDWSYALLADWDRVLFRRLAVFAGGWTLEAVEVVCADELLPRAEMLDALTHLVDQSLATVSTDDTPTRYRFLETVRAYATERMLEANEASALQSRHRDWCLKLAERAAEGMRGADGLAWYRRLSVEQENVRAALEGFRLDDTAADQELRLVAAMGQFWFPRNPTESRRRLAEALERADAAPSSARAAALIWQASFEHHYGDPATGRELARAAGVTSRHVGDWARAAEALRQLAFTTEEDGAASRMALLDEALALARLSGDKAQVAVQLGALAAAAADNREVERARLLAEESDMLARASGYIWSRLTPTIQLGWLAMADGRLDDAELHFNMLVNPSAGWGALLAPAGILGLGQVNVQRGKLDLARSLYRSLLVDLRESSPESALLADLLVYQAAVESRSGLEERAQRLLGANEGWHAAHGLARRTWRPNVWSPVMRGLVPIPPIPSDPRLVKARAEGRATTLDEAVAYALEPGSGRAEDSGPGTTRLSSSTGVPGHQKATESAAGFPDKLTSREREVATLLAEGRTNREIADHLVITEGTVEVHVKHVLSKLGRTSRTQVAALMIERASALARPEPERSVPTRD